MSFPPTTREPPPFPVAPTGGGQVSSQLQYRILVGAIARALESRPDGAPRHGIWADPVQRGGDHSTRNCRPPTDLSSSSQPPERPSPYPSPRVIPSFIGSAALLVCQALNTRCRAEGPRRAEVLSRAELRVAPGYRMRPVLRTITIAPSRGMPVVVERRL